MSGSPGILWALWSRVAVFAALIAASSVTEGLVRSPCPGCRLGRGALGKSGAGGV